MFVTLSLEDNGCFVMLLQAAVSSALHTFYRGTIGSEARMNANLGVVLFLLSKTFVNE